MLNKQHAKEKVMALRNTQYHSETTIIWMPPRWWVQRMGSILPCCLPFGKAGRLQILCCQEFAVVEYSFTLDALALKPSGFFNVRVNCPGCIPLRCTSPLRLFSIKNFTE